LGYFGVIQNLLNFIDYQNVGLFAAHTPFNLAEPKSLRKFKANKATS
jgi:hypothetical protein